APQPESNLRRRGMSCSSTTSLWDPPPANTYAITQNTDYLARKSTDIRSPLNMLNRIVPLEPRDLVL
ncbi:hypothetical protein IWQ62_002793, partial [Dispira parvispora]